jgi:hypothetical protein
VHWQALDVSKQVRTRLKGQKPSALWLKDHRGGKLVPVGSSLELCMVAEGAAGGGSSDCTLDSISFLLGEL